ncbi:hypothetical protein [Urbifossiella limnaea]|uniref:Uncharacterized protein n=1 Tax=Urbifossiella limnaea TaxID=2528023 RepID=A0A517XLC7_9BACT|nr:hypothetical protein [Urbifossiella limnaea]QDU18315.1 hypothetical protein ETAA1_02000 [Urbifossiella limnaea]
MRLEDIRQRTRKVPFEPFRVFLSNGQTFDIYHPDQCVGSTGAAHISVPSENGPPHIRDQVTIVSLYHIQKIEPLPTPAAAAGSNGAG